jgi:hypothetical protein
VGSRRRGLDFLLTPAPGRVRAQLIYSAVANYGEDPGAYGPSLGPVASRRPPDLEEDFLDQIFSRQTLAHHPVCQSVGGTAVAVVERGESLRVALGQGEQDLIPKKK